MLVISYYSCKDKIRYVDLFLIGVIGIFFVIVNKWKMVVWKKWWLFLSIRGGENRILIIIVIVIEESCSMKIIALFFGCFLVFMFIIKV